MQHVQPPARPPARLPGCLAAFEGNVLLAGRNDRDVVMCGDIFLLCMCGVQKKYKSPISKLF